MSKNENLSLEVFDNPEFGQMRIVREGDKDLFCANDAAVALGYPCTVWATSDRLQPILQVA